MESIPIFVFFGAVLLAASFITLGGVVIPYQVTFLPWPARMSYVSFVRRVTLSLRKLGWVVEKSSSPDYTLSIRRNNKRFYVVCLPTDHSLTQKKIGDYCHVIKTSKWAQAFFCITADEIDIAFANLGIFSNVFAITYRDLSKIEDIFDSNRLAKPKQMS